MQFHYLKRKLIQNRFLEKSTKSYGFYTNLIRMKPSYICCTMWHFQKWKGISRFRSLYGMYLFYFMANTCYRGAQGVFIQIKRRQRKNFKKSAPKKFALCKNLLRRKTIFGNIFLWQKSDPKFAISILQNFLSLENIQVCQYGSNLSPYWNTNEPRVFFQTFQFHSYSVTWCLGQRFIIWSQE